VEDSGGPSGGLMEGRWRACGGPSVCSDPARRLPMVDGRVLIVVALIYLPLLSSTMLVKSTQPFSALVVYVCIAFGRGYIRKSRYSVTEPTCGVS
jgi:hypothetical protein